MQIIHKQLCGLVFQTFRAVCFYFKQAKAHNTNAWPNRQCDDQWHNVEVRTDAGICHVWSSRRPFTEEGRVDPRLCRICGELSGTGRCLAPKVSVPPPPPHHQCANSPHSFIRLLSALCNPWKWQRNLKTVRKRRIKSLNSFVLVLLIRHCVKLVRP